MTNTISTLHNPPSPLTLAAMKTYALKRLMGMIPLLLGITIISFGMMHLAPGEPSVVGQAFDPKVSAQDIERLRSFYGLDKPLYEQYYNWLKRVVVFDFGNSFSADSRPVLDKIWERLPITLLISVLTIAFIFIVAIPIGIVSAVHKDSWLDKSLTVFVFIAFAVPSFWLGLLLMIALGVHMQLLPISGIHEYDWKQMSWLDQQLDLLQHLAIPVFISAIGGLASMSRFMRTGMLDVIRSEYITTARAMGVSETSIHYRLAFKNALLPIITLLGLSIPGLIGGSVIVETLFSIPGLGLLFFEAIMSRDYPLIMAITVISAILTLVGSLIADLAYAWADPRIRQ